MNLSSLAADCGITHVTAREWLTVLAASYLVRLLPPYHVNYGKRLVKTPKLRLWRHGCWVCAMPPRWPRTRCAAPWSKLQPVEIKSGTAFAADWLRSPQRWAALAGADALPPIIVYGGDVSFEHHGCRVAGWRDLAHAHEMS